jgi:polyphosphate kinase
MMHRNLDRRVEALVNLVQPDHMQELESLFELVMADNSASWHLDSNGAWTRHQYDAEGKPLIIVQDEVMRRIAAKKNRS